MRIAAITMVHNEAAFLPLWLAHYSAQFGAENLFVLDHGSDDGSTTTLKASCLKLPRTPLDEAGRATAVSNLHACLLGYYDAVIYTDVDEFLVARPSKFSNLADLFIKTRQEVVSCVGLNVLHLRDTEPALSLEKPILAQRSWVRFDPHYAKLVFSTVPIKWFPGFHSADRKSALHADFFLFHLRIADWKLFAERHIHRTTVVFSELSKKYGHGNHFHFDLLKSARDYFSDDASTVVEDEHEGFYFDNFCRKWLDVQDVLQPRDWPTARIPHAYGNSIPGTHSTRTSP